MADTKKCPFCAEEIKAEAVVCRFCHRDMDPGRKLRSLPSYHDPEKYRWPPHTGRNVLIGLAAVAAAVVALVGLASTESPTAPASTPAAAPTNDVRVVANTGAPCNQNGAQGALIVAQAVGFMRGVDVSNEGVTVVVPPARWEAFSINGQKSLVSDVDCALTGPSKGLMVDIHVRPSLGAPDIATFSFADLSDMREGGYAEGGRSHVDWTGLGVPISHRHRH